MLDQDRKEVWISNEKNLKGHSKNYELILSSVGILVLYDVKNEIIWKNQELLSESSTFNYKKFSTNNLASYRRGNRGG